ncbi:MAG: histidine kinase [Lachnospiraceae bacterium]|jgi:two-component system sensor histidine kinase YesM|nr:histidine kinase [Lachnospiraceae bacterium]
MKKGREKTKSRYVSIFTKSAAAFLGLVVFPFMLISSFMFQNNIHAVSEAAVNNGYHITKGISDDIEWLLGEIGEYSKYLYEYESDDYGYFYEIMTEGSISDILRENLVEDALKKILYRNEQICHVYFVDENKRVYSTTRAPEKIVNQKRMDEWAEKHVTCEKSGVFLIPSHPSDYYLKSDQEVFTYARNMMDTRTIYSARNKILGTLYIDVSIECFRDIIGESGLAPGERIAVADWKGKELIFASDGQIKEGSLFSSLGQDLSWQNEGQFYREARQMYYIGCQVEGADWTVIELLPRSNLEKTYSSIIRTTLFLGMLSIILLTVLYRFYARTTGKPIRLLKEAMDQIKAGNLDTRVAIDTNDELGVLGDGLNNMTQQLQKHIEKVYVSEIRQKEAQISALLTQIQPHYLYNTLDSIRMSAITHDDSDTALMLESLSAQMRYLISDTRSLVTLKEELDSIQDYFTLIQLRYENGIQLEINAQDNTLRCRIPRLTLQPIVENSVKYGVSPKGEGTIALFTEIRQDLLEITVIDDGIGMNEETLAHINGMLRGDIVREKQKSGKVSIGLNNVEERIRLQFGEDYGLTLSSTPGLGTLVKCTLPVFQREED